MTSKEVDGIICTPISFEPAKITIRGEKTGDFITVSLADDNKGVLIQVPYSEIRKVVRGL